MKMTQIVSFDPITESMNQVSILRRSCLLELGLPRDEAALARRRDGAEADQAGVARAPPRALGDSRLAVPAVGRARAAAVSV